MVGWRLVSFVIPMVSSTTVACAHETEMSRVSTAGASAEAEPFPRWAFSHETPDECGRTEPLAVEEFLPAALYVPRAASTEPSPLIVASHGAFGDPEDTCRYWCGLTNAHIVVLCLRGARTDNTRPSGYYYPNHHALGAELRNALSALRVRQLAIDPGRTMYAGFSQGAIMAALVIPGEASRFPRVAFVEGGFQYWSRASVRRFASNGGERVLFACGTEWCRRGAQQIARWLADAGVDTRVEHAPGAGHTPDGGVRERVRAALPWLLGPD